MKLSTHLPSFIAVWALFISNGSSSIDFSGQPNYVEGCVQDALANRFDFGPLDPSLDFTDCDTEMCLCKPETLQKNIPVYYSKASSICVERGGDGRAGGQQATSVINAFCNEKGYTSRIAPATTFATSTATLDKPSSVDTSATNTPGPVPTSSNEKPVPTVSSPPMQDGKSLSTGAQVGIAVGSIAATVIMGLFGWWVARRYSARGRRSSTDVVKIWALKDLRRYIGRP